MKESRSHPAGRQEIHSRTAQAGLRREPLRPLAAGVLTLFVLLAFLPQAVQGEVSTSTIGNDNSWVGVTGANCGGGEAAVGIDVQGAMYVDQVTLWCAPLNNLKAGNAKAANGAVKGNNIWDSGFARQRKTVYCRDGYVITAIRGKGGTYVDSIVSIRCTKWKSSTHEWRTVRVGGGGGRTQTAYCPDGTYVVKTWGKAGAWVDALWARCESW